MAEFDTFDLANWVPIPGESKHPDGCSCGSPDCPHNPFNPANDTPCGDDCEFKDVFDEAQKTLWGEV